MGFLKDILSGRKKYFKLSEVKQANVPRYRELTIKSILQYALTHQRIKHYIPWMPDPTDPFIDRKFMVAIVNTIEPDYFPAAMRKIQKTREE